MFQMTPTDLNPSPDAFVFSDAGIHVRRLLFARRVSKAIELIEATPFFNKYELSIFLLLTLEKYSFQKGCEMAKALQEKGLDLFCPLMDSHGEITDFFNVYIHDCRDLDPPIFQKHLHLFSELGLDISKQDFPYILNYAISCSNFAATQWILEQEVDLETTSSKWSQPFREVWDGHQCANLPRWKALLERYEVHLQQQQLHKTLPEGRPVACKPKL